MTEPINEAVVRLRRNEGQVRGLQQMLAKGRPYEEVITQFMAARAALDKVGISLVAHHLQDCTRRQSAGNACEGELERALGLFLRMDTRSTAAEAPAAEWPDEAAATAAPVRSG